MVCAILSAAFNCNARCRYDSNSKPLAQLKLLPAYVGVASLEEAIRDPHACRLLWLEILVNDQLDLDPWLTHTTVKDAYQKACRWYTHYGSLITSALARTPLPSDTGPIDAREHRTFVEAIRFAAGHP